MLGEFTLLKILLYIIYRLKIIMPHPNIVNIKRITTSVKNMIL